jgi:galactokinase
MVRLMTAAWETAWRGKTAILAGDMTRFGRLMNDNHRLVDNMMVYCGFPDGADWCNNLLIETALKDGALGAKLTGRRASTSSLSSPGLVTTRWHGTSLGVTMSRS